MCQPVHACQCLGSARYKLQQHMLLYDGVTFRPQVKRFRPLVAGQAFIESSPDICFRGLKCNNQEMWTQNTMIEAQSSHKKTRDRPTQKTKTINSALPKTQRRKCIFALCYHQRRGQNNVYTEHERVLQLHPELVCRWSHEHSARMRS